jgi:valyl-tRNA synthetase
MSKTKGNVIDPLDIIEKYGADALRFTLAILTQQGRRHKTFRKRGLRDTSTLPTSSGTLAGLY